LQRCNLGPLALQVPSASLLGGPRRSFDPLVATLQPVGNRLIGDTMPDIVSAPGSDLHGNFAVYRGWLEAEGTRLAEYRAIWSGWGQQALLDVQGQTLFSAATAEYVLDSVQGGTVWIAGGRLNGRTPRGIRWEVSESKQNIVLPDGVTPDRGTFEALLSLGVEACPVAYGVCS
jgi:hypothetical protein